MAFSLKNETRQAILTVVALIMLAAIAVCLLAASPANGLF
jgi:hypothetical protein